MRRRVLVVVVAVIVAAALLTAIPGGLGLAGRTPLAQVVPFRGVLALALLALAGLSGASALLPVRGTRPEGRSSRRGRVAGLRLGVASGLLVAALAHVAVLAARGLDPSAPVARQDGDLVVLSLNTEFGGSTVQQVVAAAARGDADVVVLPETPAAAAQEIADALAVRGRTFTALTATTSELPTHATSLVLAEDLGETGPATAPDVGLAAVAAAPANLPGPVVAVHTMAPVPGTGTGMVQRWHQDLHRVAAACAGTPGAVVAGDLNATLDHPGLRDLGPCVDAAAHAGAGGLGTWPATVPELLAAPIDHVLVDGRAWRVVSADVVTVGSSDHRGLLVHLARRG